MPRDLKNRKVYDWKRYGLICREGETYDDIFDRVQNTTNCELCNILLTEGNCKTGRAMDHNHSTGYFRMVLCMKCNIHHDTAMYPQNKTGHKNISFCKKRNKYVYSKQMNKKQHHKRFATLEEAIEYKLHFEKKIKDNV